MEGLIDKIVSLKIDCEEGTWNPPTPVNSCGILRLTSPDSNPETQVIGVCKSHVAELDSFDSHLQSPTLVTCDFVSRTWLKSRYLIN